MSLRHINDKLVFGDTWHMSTGNKVDMFCLQYQKRNAENAGDLIGCIGHYSSKDLLKWKAHKEALRRGNPGSYDDLEHWTGCSIEHDGKYYLFYTSRSSNLDMFSISVAISTDGENYVKYSQNPLFVPDERYYYGPNKVCDLGVHGNWDLHTYDLRDFCVVEDKNNGCFWGFFAVRKYSNNIVESSVIGLAKSYDLLNWEQFPPCFEPKKYHCIETPDVFYMDGKWYMLCLSGNCYGGRVMFNGEYFDRYTIWAVSDKIEGPYVEVKNNDLISNTNASGACAKTVLYKNQRYVFYTEVFDKTTECFMSVPKVVKKDNNGLFLEWYETIEKYYSNKKFLFNKNTLIQKDLSWGSLGEIDYKNGSFYLSIRNDYAIFPFNIICKNFVFEADIENIDAVGCGLAFDLGNNILNGGNVAFIDFKVKKAIMTTLNTFPLIERKCLYQDRKKFKIKIFVMDNTFEMYIDNRFVFHHLIDRNIGKIGFFIDNGSAHISNIKLHAIKNMN